MNNGISRFIHLSIFVVASFLVGCVADPDGGGGDLPDPGSSSGSSSSSSSSSGATPGLPEISDGLVLMNTATGEPVPGFNPLQDNAVINSADLDISQLTIIASENSSMASVRFGLDGNDDYRVESRAPYALFSDDGTILTPWSLGVGEHTVSATPYSEASGGGVGGNTISVRFTIVAFSLTASPTTLVFSSITGAPAPEQQTVTLNNTGNIEGDFVIENIPGQLSVTPQSGTLAAGGSVDITIGSQACQAIENASFDLAINAGAQASTTINVTRNCGSDQAQFDYDLSRFYFNQAVPAADTAQQASDRVRTVMNRPGLARAFVIANDNDAPLPAVKLFWQDGQGNTGSYDLTGPNRSRTQINEGRINETFNVQLPEDFFRAGMRYYVEVDPNQAIPETLESNNRYPEQGYADLNAFDVPVHRFTFIPITIGSSVTNIDERRGLQLYERTRAMVPLSDFDMVIRDQAFTYDNQIAGAGWQDLLRKIDQLRRRDNNGRYYHAITESRVVSGGVAGIAYRGGLAALSIPNSGVIAHEFGHNFSLSHAPCGGPAGPDSQYPYPDAIVNIYGYDFFRNVITLPDARDFMSYCRNNWIADFSYEKVLGYRGRRGSSNRKATSSAPVMQKTLLVGGSLTNEVFSFDDFSTAEVVSAETSVGTYQVVGKDVFGVELVRQGFDLQYIDDLELAHFNVAIPFEGVNSTIHSLEIVAAHSGEVLATHQRQSLSGAQKSRIGLETSASVVGEGKVKVVWDASLHNAVTIKDLATDNIVAIAASGEVIIDSYASTLEISYQNGFDTSVQTIDVE